MSDLAFPDYLERTASDMLVELHVYVMPVDLWRDHLHSAINQMIGETVSAGFIRVYPETLLCDIRNQVTKQLGYEIVPRNYVFLRCIGRCFTQVKHKQERELKAKHFMPPIAHVPELFVLDSKLATENDEAEELERLRLAELLRREREEEERRRRLMEEEERRRRLMDEDERRRRLLEEEERRRRLMEEELERRRRQPSPPPRPPSFDEKHRIRKELEKLRLRRDEMEKQRDELMRRAKMLEMKQSNRKSNSRDTWKKKYFEEKKKTPPVEDQCTKLRQQLEQNHRKIIGQLEYFKDSSKRSPGDKAYEQIVLKIKASRYEHDIEELHTKLQTVKMKITTEIRLRYQAECQLQALRAQLAQKKVDIMMSRSVAYNAVGNGSVFDQPLTTSRTLPALTSRSQLNFH